MVPTSSLLIMVLNLILGFAVPILLACWMVRKYDAKWSTILIGAATFFVFALVLEAIVHRIVLKGSLGETIQGNTWYLALYGGLMAGLFEETGRFLSMKYLLKKEPSTVVPGLAYGVGHGGAEMAIIFGLSMVSYLAIAVMANAGQADTLLSQTPADARDQVNATVTAITETRPGTLLLGLWERISALILHLSLSVLVWTAVRKGGKWLWLFPAAILLHALIDSVAVLLKDDVNMAVLELIVFVMSLAIAAIAYMVAKKHTTNMN